MSGPVRIGWFVLSVVVLVVCGFGFVPYFTNKNLPLTPTTFAHFLATIWSAFWGIGLLLWSFFED